MDSPYITDQQLLAALASTLRVDPATMPTAWLDGSGNGIVHDCNITAFQSVRAKLLARGFLDSQVLSWDRGVEFNRDIGIFWCLVRGAALHSYDFNAVKLLDRRKELDDAVVELNGTPQQPSDQPAVIGYGRLDEGGDRWRRGPHGRGCEPFFGGHGGCFGGDIMGGW